LFVFHLGRMDCLLRKEGKREREAARGFANVALDRKRFEMTQQLLKLKKEARRGDNHQMHRENRERREVEWERKRIEV
jgi:hypothetical protein